MSYYILFMCFYTRAGYQVCSSAQFPDVKQCHYSASKIKERVASSQLWCQEVKDNKPAKYRVENE